MNERIRELALQANANELSYAYYRGEKKPENAVTLHSVDLEKFAELIVQECSRVIVNGGYWSGGPLGPRRQCTPPEIAQMVKEHFGVAE